MLMLLPLCHYQLAMPAAGAAGATAASMVTASLQWQHLLR
jgi:hypothetical protein